MPHVGSKPAKVYTVYSDVFSDTSYSKVYALVSALSIMHVFSS